MAYVIDEQFNKVSEGYPSDRVARVHGALVSYKDNIPTYFVPQYK